jgi:DNA-binding transcriptional LysR family regulator
MDLRRLRYFVTVAEERNFRRAAERLHMSQPPLSQQIQALEQDLNVRLFVRDRRSVVLTAAGETLLRRARTLLESAAAAATEVQQVGRGELGRLVASFMSSAMLGRFSEILQDFRTTNPGVAVQLTQLPPSEQIAAVSSGLIDIGFLSIAPASRRMMANDVELCVEPIWDEELVAAVSASHRLANKSKILLRSLEPEAFITLPSAPQTGYFDQLVRLCRTAGFEPRVHEQVEQLPVALTLIAAGYGVGIMPVCVCEGWHRLVAFPRLKGAPRISVMMIWRKDNPSPVLRAFRESIMRAAPYPFYAAPRVEPRAPKVST